MQNSPIAHQRVLNYAYVDTDTLYQDFQIPQQGYNEKQVGESRIAYGRNVLSGRASDTVLYRLRRAFVNPFTVILFVLAAVSFLTDVVLASNFSRNITTSVIILCMLLLSGIQMLGIGVVGQYLAKTYLETKHRPIYLTRLTNIEKKAKKEEA